MRPRSRRRTRSTATQPGVATALASLAVNGAPAVSVGVRLMGPGHVTGLQPAQVIRTDPTRGSRAFEPNYFPLIEFDEPSLPWLFTPVAANAQQQLRPWLCLAVVRQQPGVRLDPPRRGSLPVLTIAPPADAVDRAPGSDDELGVGPCPGHRRPPAGRGRRRKRTGPSPRSRGCSTSGRPSPSPGCVSGRILEPGTDYLACVVPTFELGRLAGLGLEITTAEEGRLLPAWTVGDELTSVELPGVLLVGLRHRTARRLPVAGDAARGATAAGRCRRAPDRRHRERRGGAGRARYHAPAGRGAAPGHRATTDWLAGRGRSRGVPR